MRTQKFIGVVFVLATSMLVSGADVPPAGAGGAMVTVDAETLRRMVEAEVRRELPAAVQAEVRKQIAEAGNRNGRMNSAASMLQTLRGQLELYKIQHGDAFPALTEMASWKALLNKTDTHGNYIDSGKMVLGPYIQAAPANVFTGRSNVVAIGTATAHDGWSWDSDTGRLRIVIPASETDAVKAFGNEAEVPGQSAAEVKAGSKRDQARAVASTLQTLRGQLELYRIQHGDQFPTWEQMADWKVLLNGTETDGSLGKKYGPYIARPAVNPLSGKSAIAPIGSAKADAGWVYDGKNGQIRAVVSADDEKAFAGMLGGDSIEVAK